MFFTRIASVLAWLALVLGCIELLLGFGIAIGFVVEPTPGRYLGSKTTGQTIDAGIIKILVAIVFGTLSEITKILKQK